MLDTWLLTTHCAALFPMGVFIWSWKRRKDASSIFMLIKFLYAVTFSLLYHSHHSFALKMKYLLVMKIMTIGLY